MYEKNLSTIFDITAFGAVPGSGTSCTEAVKSAVEACRKAGGGTVYIPAGEFITGPIHMVSNMTLYLDAGARLLFAQNKEEYPLVYTRWEGAEHHAYSPLIYGFNLENIAVMGRGILDGQGEYWWKLERSKSLENPRPRFISFESCNNILIEGVTLLNSPAWTVNPIRSQNITIHKIAIKNPADSPNTDGINPDSCKNVRISNCHVDVGDDCITIKSGTEDCSVRVPCENITVTNCTMVHGHGGVVIGSEMSGDVRNVVITNCVFEGTDRGIRMKSRRGRGGVVEDIRINNIVMKDVISPIVLHLFYYCGPKGKDKYVWDKSPYPVDQGTPAFRRIHFSNITARNVHAAAGFIYGLPEMPLEEITFDNISVEMAENAVPGMPAMMSNLEPVAKKGFFGCNTRDIRFNNVKVTGQDGPAFSMEDSQNIEFAGCSGEGIHNGEPVIVLSRVRNAFIHGCRSTGEKEVFAELVGADTAGIEFAGNSKNISRKNVKLTGGALEASVEF